MTHQPFSRLVAKDQDTNRIVQDIYDKLTLSLSQTGTNVTNITNVTQQVTSLAKQVAAVEAKPPVMVIEDTLSNQVNYPADKNPSGLYWATDSRQLFVAVGTSWVPASYGTMYGTHASRPAAASVAPGTLYMETDRGYMYVVELVVSVPNWIFVTGESFGTFELRWTGLTSNDRGALYCEISRSSVSSAIPLPVYQWSGLFWVPYSETIFQRAQSELGTLAGTLAAGDTGVKVYVTDYAHTLVWSGSGWTWAPEDDLRAGEGPIYREVDPSPSTGWHLYDGSVVSYLRSTGALGSATLPDLTGTNAAYVKAGGSNSGPTAAVAPTFSGTFTGTADTTGVNNMTILVIPAATGLPDFLTGDSHTHPFTPSGTIAGTVTSTGEPRRLQRRAFFRQ